MRQIGFHRNRKPIRLKGWDYRRTGAYFVTICIKDRQHFLGEIRNGIMGLSHQGIIAHWFWLQIPQQFSHIELDAFIVMPNHVHGILWITDGNVKSRCRDAINRVPTAGGGTNSEEQTGSTDNKPVHSTGGGITGKHNPMNSGGNLGQIIRWYKGRCSFEIHQRDYSSFGWQTRFHDHIIRNERELDRIRDYIINNPLKWNEDRFY